MKVLILSSPKCGNVWVLNILKNYLNLTPVSYNDFFQAQDNVISFEHINYNRPLHEKVLNEKIIVFTLVREPFQQFQSLVTHHIRHGEFDLFTQQFSDIEDISQDAIFSSFKFWFKANALISIGWSNFFPVLSYDSLVQNPFRAIQKLLEQFNYPLDRNRLNFSLCVSQRSILESVSKPSHSSHFIKSRLNDQFDNFIKHVLPSMCEEDRIFQHLKFKSAEMVNEGEPKEFEYRDISNITDYKFFPHGAFIDTFSYIAFYHLAFIEGRFPPIVNETVLKEFHSYLMKSNDSYGPTINNYLAILLTIRTDVLRHVTNDGDFNIFYFYNWLLTYGKSEYGIQPEFIRSLDEIIVK